MTTMDNFPTDSIVEYPEVTEVVERLRSGAPFVGLLIDGVDRRAAALEAVLDQVMHEDTRLAWVGNPLRSPLTIERMFLQAVGPEADLRVERDPAELARMLVLPASPHRRKLIVVQQPESINAETRELLAAMAPHWMSGDVAVQFLFVGTSNFCVPAAGAIARDTALAPAAWVDEPQAPARRWEAVPLLLLLVVVLLGVLISWVPAAPGGLLGAFIQPDETPATPPPVDANGDGKAPGVTPLSASPAIADPAVPPQTAAAPATQVPVAGDDVAMLRQEFDVFLAQRAATMPAMTEQQKAQLFQEFLARQSQRQP